MVTGAWVERRWHTRSWVRRVDRSEGFGERLLGLLPDRAPHLPPQLIAPLIAEEVGRVGGRDGSILLQDYAQELLVPLPGRRLHVSQPEPVIDSPAGRAFLRGEVVEVPLARGGVRMYLPLLDGSDTVGVMVLTRVQETQAMTRSGKSSPLDAVGVLQDSTLAVLRLDHQTPSRVANCQVPRSRL